MKKTVLLSILGIGLANFGNAQVTITNNTNFNTADQMLLANEINFSGEPFAEFLGNDLGLLDPMLVDQPNQISYTLGIENYEYSRYLLQVLGAQSGMGLHMMWSPLVEQMAAMQPASFDGSFTGGMANGFKEDDQFMMIMGNFQTDSNQAAPANPFPQFIDFMSGNMQLPQTVTANADMDFASLRWDRTLMDKTLNPAAMGQSLMKQYLWARDMLGAFHDAADNGIDADGTNSPDLVGSPMFDPNNNIYYGGNNLDGFMGQVLTAQSIAKTMFLINKMAYDGTTLGAVDPATYNPANGIKYFPHKILATEGDMGMMLPPMLNQPLTVTDATSYLFDQISYLWATSGYKNMMDPTINDTPHYAYHEVFDGFPFPASMAETGTPGPFDLMMGTSKVLFLNTMAMHYNATSGTFVDTATLSGGVVTKGNTISAKNAAYSLVVLGEFATQFSATPMLTDAVDALNAQANFIITNLKDATGGYNNSFTIGTGASTSVKTLATQAAIIRGLYAAYSYTANATYKTEADNLYSYMLNNFYLPTAEMFKTELGNDLATYTPNILALLSGAMREAKITGNQTDAELIYTRVFKTTYNKMILAESMVTGETGGDSDSDGIPAMAGGTRPYAFAAEGTFTFSPLSTNSFDAKYNVTLYPNPATENIVIKFFNFNLDKNIKATIYDISGRTISSTSANSDNQRVTIPLHTLTNGTYFVRLTSNNDTIGIEKFIKQ
ncbi:MAG: T9SS type A sorting domain-containing protein [Flavobacteriia bacterium]|nr:T9SS type A sorting domain-containing protein [Flavobacteriia bacterium]OIP45279.1 MAG: hypothetical protein AUK46_12535 [Flavobacteriaceae bacterium CG2_30_31_66]PIX12556.1 MAG: hypothetical protein COZ74_10895 [Flavobacteriaceae bacterium CG_4_8_14_3_um_filter_31_8]PIY14098.1 MAG: hypothetical protein COZ16_10800 [Flavobacteriaceae bacterium CG_4_10_14_3_um_filter_31_253]PIZ10218.1 MAG: hypothetical protein COY55_09380 [Flavobacteriaceae bacterium CG_4_10_14_0_8_um_filter_31_99]PJC09125.1